MKKIILLSLTLALSISVASASPAIVLLGDLYRTVQGLNIPMPDPAQDIRNEPSDIVEDEPAQTLEAPLTDNEYGEEVRIVYTLEETSTGEIYVDYKMPGEVPEDAYILGNDLTIKDIFDYRQSEQYTERVAEYRNIKSQQVSSAESTDPEGSGSME